MHAQVLIYSVISDREAHFAPIAVDIGVSRNSHRGCLTICAKKVAATPTFIDNTHQFKGNTPVLRCVLLRIKLSLGSIATD